MSKLTVYKQMISSPADLISILKNEQMGKNFLSAKTSLTPFAIKAIGALSELYITTEAQSTKAANVFISGLQTLAQAGITAEDFDLMDFVKRDNCIVVSARVELLIRAAARKGYRLSITFVPVPQEDAATTYYKEHFFEGKTFYVLEDLRNNGDRKITPERLIGNYFNKFLCRIEVASSTSDNILAKEICEMPVEDVLRAHNSSDYGMVKSKWQPVFDEKGQPVYKEDGKQKKEKVFTGEFNIDSIWYKWTTSMVEKTVLRRALKRLRHQLPELKEVIYAFDNDTVEAPPPQPTIEVGIPLVADDVDLDNLTDPQTDDVKETYELFCANPKLASDEANKIIAAFDGSNAQAIINVHYASIVNIRKSERLYPVIRPLFEGFRENEHATSTLSCSECGKEITSEKSKKYYAEHPTYIPKCYDCNNRGR